MLPDGFERVYDAHGLVGVCSTFLGLTKQPVYPCNLEVIDLAQGIIVHSEFARSLLQNWYGKRVYEESAVVPFPCPSAIACTAGSQSKKLESSKSIVCSFGYLGPSKLNHSLFEAWVESVSDYSVLVFVGAEGEKEYCDVLKEKIHSSGYSEKVFFTGWVSEKDYLNWMEKATLSVQLRTNSRGETSASLFDCFSNGVPSIINRHGDMSSLPSTIALAVQDEFTKEELGVALKTLLDNTELREYYSENARIYIEENHRPEKCADKYFSTIEAFYGSSRGSLTTKLLKLSENNLLPAKKVEIDSFLKSLLKTTLPTYRKKTLFVDLSEIVKGDIRTGIQRVVRNILRGLVENNKGSDGLRIEPIYSTGKGTNYVSAARFFSRLFELPHTMEEREVEWKRGDIFLGLDLQPLIVPEQKQLLLEMQARGIRVQFIVYDILPLTHREYFSPGVYNHFFRWFETITNFEKLICISETTKKEVGFFLRAFFPERLENTKLESFALGNKLPEEDLSKGDPKKVDIIREIMNRGNLFLLVGTLEPRKGHASVLGWL